jgi:FkbM family methyltransferase
MSKLVSWIELFDLPKRGVIHIGAHAAQEASDYAHHELEPVRWFEAIPSLVERAKLHLAQYPNQEIHEALFWSEPGEEKVFNLASNDLGSSSIFDFHLHSASYPEVKMSDSLLLVTTTLDIEVSNYSKLSEKVAYLVLDVQGAELEVLRGAANSLERFDVIMSEVSTRELYKGAPVYSNLIDWLKVHGFTLIAEDLNNEVGWGDALFMKTSLLNTHYTQIHPLDTSVGRGKPSWPVILRGVLVRVGIKPRYLTRGFLIGIFKRRP